MKQVVLTLFILHVFAGVAQTKHTPVPAKKLLGFNVGLNYTNIQSKEPISANSKIYDSPGFRLGLLMDCPITKNLVFSPKAELAFNESKVRVTHPDNSVNYYDVFRESIELMGHIVIKKAKGRLQPYILLGPAIRITFTDRPKFVGLANNPDLAADIGIGFEKIFSKFHFAPELRYSAGLFNINKYPAVPSALYFHNIVLTLNFKG